MSSAREGRRGRELPLLIRGIWAECCCCNAIAEDVALIPAGREVPAAMVTAMVTAMVAVMVAGMVAVMVAV